eukprot:scaffold128140_cov22-Tisochrysis_lutea.AAC.1
MRHSISLHARISIKVMLTSSLVVPHVLTEQYQDEDSAVTALKLLAQHALQAPGEGQGGNAGEGEPGKGHKSLLRLQEEFRFRHDPGVPSYLFQHKHLYI